MNNNILKILVVLLFIGIFLYYIFIDPPNRYKRFKTALESFQSNFDTYDWNLIYYYNQKCLSQDCIDFNTIWDKNMLNTDANATLQITGTYTDSLSIHTIDAESSKILKTLQDERITNVELHTIDITGSTLNNSDQDINIYLINIKTRKTYKFYGILTLENIVNFIKRYNPPPPLPPKETELQNVATKDNVPTGNEASTSLLDTIPAAPQDTPYSSNLNVATSDTNNWSC